MIYLYFYFFFNDTATTEIYTLSLHDALPISARPSFSSLARSNSEKLPSSLRCRVRRTATNSRASSRLRRSEEHTSELQSQSNLVCRLLLEKKKTTKKKTTKTQHHKDVHTLHY